jgi:NitT/TauT family transport system ATP-binding protein
MSTGEASGALTATASPLPRVSVNEVSKTYRSRRGMVHALDRVDLRIAENEFVSVVGPSGCGKSTLLMIVSGLIPLSGGVVEIAGERVTRAHTDLGVVFQDDALLEWRTVLDNVLLQCEIRRLSRKEYRPRALELLEMTGLKGFEDKYPYELSGGMRQRVAICRGLVHSPRLLLMDEPFGALDALTREQMGFDLARLHENSKTSVLFITHSIPEAVLLSDRVVVMSARPGRIVETLDLDLPRPRTMAMAEGPGFTGPVQRIRALFAAQGVLDG